MSINVVITDTDPIVVITDKANMSAAGKVHLSATWIENGYVDE